MNFDPLFLAIGLAALVAAVVLKVQQAKRKKAERKIMEHAAVIAARRRMTEPETRGKLLANERDWQSQQ